MPQKIMKEIYSLTNGKVLKEIPVKMLRTSCAKIAMDVLCEKLIELEARGYINTVKKIVDGSPKILTVEMTTYGKVSFELTKRKI